MKEEKKKKKSAANAICVTKMTVSVNAGRKKTY